MKKRVVDIAPHHVGSKMRARHKHATWPQKKKNRSQKKTHWKSKIIIIRCEKQNSNREKHVKKLLCTCSNKRIKDKTSWTDLK